MGVVSFTTDSLESLLDADFSKLPYQRVVYFVLAKELLRVKENYDPEVGFLDEKIMAKEAEIKEIVFPIHNKPIDVIIKAAKVPFNKKVVRYLEKGIDTVIIDSEMERIADKIIASFGWDYDLAFRQIVITSVLNAFWSKHIVSNDFPGKLSPSFYGFAIELNYQILKHDRFDLIQVYKDLKFFAKAA
jgi:hypothetical protein